MIIHAIKLPDPYFVVLFNIVIGVFVSEINHVYLFIVMTWNMLKTKRIPFIMFRICLFFSICVCIKNILLLAGKYRLYITFMPIKV